MTNQTIRAVLSRVVAERGAPGAVRSDNGSDFIAQALLAWVAKIGSQTAYIDPGKPWQNGVNERFNGTACLKMDVWASVREA